MSDRATDIALADRGRMVRGMIGGESADWMTTAVDAGEVGDREFVSTSTAARTGEPRTDTGPSRRSVLRDVAAAAAAAAVSVAEGEECLRFVDRVGIGERLTHFGGAGGREAFPFVRGIGMGGGTGWCRRGACVLRVC